ncbi:hypothetical protein N657DRAFT_642941 [Parathielavia appendiculata]|uniref:DUF7053 domain-containing protein n=1 Tax=Parathielavia appendiculata TaxID=2587402 RepID=A0AAN6U5E7_9PEZI|nr:hypothetical protein N657DRAFT_642941 [Parathielavia appendiculata]
MIDLNPLVKERHPISTPPHAQADELHCQWYSLTDKIAYLPGVAGDVSYTCAFNDLPTGLQTHCYAPAGLTIRDKWTVGGSLSGEPTEPIELGLRVPPSVLYLREDVDMRCNVIMAGFVKKTLKKSHAALVDRLKVKAQIATSASSFKANRNSSSSAESSEPTKPIGGGTARRISISSLPYHLLSASVPTSRPSSVASSVVSTASSPSIYSTPSSPTLSSPASSLGAGPASSALSPPTAHSSGPQRQSKQRPDESVAWLSLALRTANRTEQKPEIASVSVRISEPETPFLLQQQPDWPLTTQRAVPAPRRQGQLLLHAYGLPASHSFSAGAASSNMESPNNSISAGRDDVLSPDALWHALGGGRLAATNAANYKANSSQQPHPGNHNRGHPDYPQMGPYDDESNGAVVELGVAGLRPLPLRAKP